MRGTVDIDIIYTSEASTQTVGISLEDDGQGI